ncbi:hypothetical protein F4054_20015 [Candidatus Poribacteria bacterium]|nr:hypothetical protein [Candidatus Poribacteria bacterium]
MIKNTLYERMSKIRDLINMSRKQHILLQDRVMWRILCAAMDDIEDTEKILEDFLKEDFDSSDKGIEFLPTYDVCDTLIAQQTSVEKLHESLKIPYTKDPSLENIRQICIDTKEHLKNEGIGKAPIPTNIPDLIANQKYIFRKILNRVINTLRDEELEHRRKFKSKKLYSTFHITSYWFEKIYDAIFSEESPHALMVGGHVNSILSSVNEFKADLKEREEPDDNISDIYENINYSLEHIKKYFCSNENTHLQEKDVYIFAYFARRQVKELESIAQYLDEKYSQGHIP